MLCFTTRSASAASKSALIGNTLPRTPRVTAHIELDWVRLLDFETVRSFLVDIATHVSEYRPGTVDYVQAIGEINRAMTFVVWNALTAARDNFDGATDYDAPIEVELTGSASFYLNWRKHMRSEAAKAGQQRV
jgi:hypothetical protein